MEFATARELWAERHGRCKPIARTEIYPAGHIIVSTVLLENGIEVQGDAFAIYETRVFCGKCDGHESRTKSVLGLADGIRTAILRHNEAITLVVNSYLSES